jgi:hypothetical protein
MKIKGISSTLAGIKIDFEKSIETQLKSKLEDLVEELKEVTPVDTGEARDGWKVTKSGIENDVEHISVLNKGSSQQAPEYFIERALLANKGVKPNGIIVIDK